MSIATEIQRLKTAKSDLKTAIEEKDVEVGNGLIDTYADKVREISGGGGGSYEQGYENGYEDGKNSVVPLDRCASSIQFNNLNLFGKEEVTVNLDNTTTLANLFNTTNVDNENTVVKHLTINCPNPVTSINFVVRAANKDEKLEHITFNVDISKVITTSYTFYRLYALKVIDGIPLDFSSATTISNGTFSSCPVLEDVRVVKESIKTNITVPLPSASDETVQSFIDGLANLTDSNTRTITFHATVGAKLTEEQKATITAKNWTLVY